MKRRTILKHLSSTAVLGVVGVGTTGADPGSGAAATKDIPDTVLVSGTSREKYISQAFNQYHSNESYSEIRSRLSDQNYTVSTDDGLVTKRGDTGEYSVLLPIQENGSSLNGISNSQATSSSNTSDPSTLANFVWRSNSPGTGFVIRTDPVKTIVSSSLLSAVPDNAKNNTAIEVVKDDRHEVGFFAEAATASTEPTASARDTQNPDITAYSIDMDGQMVTNDRSGATTGSEPSIQANDCPASISAILGYITGCAGFTAGCATVLSGNLSGLVGCLGAVSCGCGIGCCLGQAEYTGVCPYADTIIAVGTGFGPAGYGETEVAMAYCIRDGCNGLGCNPL